ncbi:MAG: murein biosynthesis integral membrane protein MurJ [Spirochaetales bacterium]
MNENNASEQSATEQTEAIQDRSMRSSARSAAVVMSATLASRLLGFVKMAVIGTVFGAGARADVLHLVFVIPNNLRKLLAEGALSSAFIPVLSERIVKDENRRAAWSLVRSIITFQAIILVPLVTASIVWSGPVTRVILDFNDAGQAELAASLFRYIIPYLLFISVSAVLVGTLNSHNRFLIPALAPLAFSICVILALSLLSGKLDVYAMAAGVLTGGVLQLLILVPQFRRLGYSFRPLFSFGSADVRRVLRQWGPVVATASVYTINQQIAVRFASGLEPGSGSAMQNALVFWQLPFGLFSSSVTTVLFPRMSREIANRDSAGIRNTLETGFRYLIALLIPSAVFLAFYGRPTISVALQSGAFTPEDSELAGAVLAAYCLGLLSVGAFNFFQRFFYASGDYRVPLYTAVGVLIIDVALSIWLINTPLRVIGLAVAHSVAFSVGLAVLVLLSIRRVGAFEGTTLLSESAKSIVGSIILLLYLLVVRAVDGQFWIAGRSVGTFFAVIGIASAGGMLVVAVLWLLKAEIVTVFLRNRIARR